MMQNLQLVQRNHSGITWLPQNCILGLFMLFFLVGGTTMLKGQSSTVLINEDFSSASGSTPPTGWVNNTITGKSFDVWRFDNPGGRSLNSSFTGNFAIFDSDAVSHGGGAEEVALISPVFNAANASTLILDVDVYFSGGYGGGLYIDVFNGSSWNNAGYATSSVVGKVTLDVTSFAAGASNAQVRFRWVGNWSYYWAIDNVVITGTSLIDNDGDGIADDRDLDDDNDGIPDSMEGSATGCEDLLVYTGDYDGNIYELNLRTGVSTWKTTSIYVSGVINALAANPDEELIYYGDGTVMYYWDHTTNTHHILEDLAGKISGQLESGGATYHDGNLYVATETPADGLHVDIYRIPVAADGKSFSGNPISLGPSITGGYGDIIYVTKGDAGTIYASTTHGFWAFDLATGAVNNYPSNTYAYQLGATPDGSLWSSTGNTIQRLDETGVAFGPTYTSAKQATDMTGPFSCKQVDTERDTDGDGIIDSFDLDSDNDGIPDLVEAGGTDANGDGLVDGIAANGSLLVDLDGDGWFDTFDNDATNSAISGVPQNLGNIDVDGDTYPNYIDLDADNDGILDIVEANGTDSDNDGMIDDTEGSNGYSNSLDPADGGTPYMFALAAGNYVSGATGSAATFVDTDGDTVPDFVDADADNDGILDYIEAQATGTATTQAYIAPANSIDAKGVPTSYTTYQNYSNTHVVTGGPTYGIQPYNHDGDAMPDYLDLDSDADGYNDIDEAWDSAYDFDKISDIIFAIIDTDGDGLLACFDADDTDPTNRVNGDNPPKDNAFQTTGANGNVEPEDFANLDGDIVLLYSVFPNNTGDDGVIQPDWRDVSCAGNAGVTYPITESAALLKNGKYVLNNGAEKSGEVKLYDYCDDLIEAGWRYYHDPLDPSQILFAIQHGSNTTEIDYVELRRDATEARNKKKQGRGKCGGGSLHPDDLPYFEDIKVKDKHTDDAVSKWEIENKNDFPLKNGGNHGLRYNWYVYDQLEGEGNIIQSAQGLTNTGKMDFTTVLAKSIVVEWYIEDNSFNSGILGCVSIKAHKDHTSEGTDEDDDDDDDPDAGSQSSSADASYGTFVMPRDWYVHTANGADLTSPVKVRFYYDPADYNLCVSNAQNFADVEHNTMGTAVWFKTDDRFENDDIDPDLGLENMPGYTLMDVENYGMEQGKTYVQFQNITGFSGGGLIIETEPTFPVEWSMFEVNPVPSGALLEWGTSAEINVDHFLVERSIDGKLFSPVSDPIKATGINSQGDNYQYVDTDLPMFPGIDRIYYRIKEIDKDGYTDFSNTVELAISGDNQPLRLNIYPNPVSGPTTIEYQSASGPIDQMLILNSLGKTMKVFTGAELNQSQEKTIDVTTWAAGVYYVKIETSTQSKTFKFIKK